jgi:hypothetical protein
MSKSQEDIYTHPEGNRQFSLARFVTESRAFVLLFALFLQILFSGPDMGGPLVDTIIRLFTVLAAIIMSADSRRHLIVGLALGVPSFLLITFSSPQDGEFTDWATYVFTLGLYLFIIRLMLLQIFNAPVITINTIGQALCTYVLLGAIWVMFYTVVVAFDPNAFSVPILHDEDAFHTLGYFSYVTLTTLGYGDISPVSNVARNLAVLEAITGVLFLAVLISRLVGSYVSRRDQ